MATGSLTISIPNGIENGNLAWISGVDYDVEWSWAGNVGTNVTLQYSLSGTNGPWLNIDSGVSRGRTNGLGSYTWTLPELFGLDYTNCYVRVRDPLDDTIVDISDGAFSILQKFRVTEPNGGERWYLGQSNNLVWESAYDLAAVVEIKMAPDGSNYTHTVEAAYDQNANGTSNIYPWTVPVYNPSLLSSNVRMRVTKPFFGTLPATADESDACFSIAGMSITKPSDGARAVREEPYSIEWTSWGAGDFVAIDLSVNGGTNYTSLTPSMANGNGTNSFEWLVAGDGSDIAVVRITSLTDSNAVAYSPSFTLASIRVTSPTNNDEWLRHSTQTINWNSSDAGEFVDVYYSVNDGTTWDEVETGVPNTHSHVWDLPEFVSREARVKVVSRSDTNLQAVSEKFSLAGARVTYPNSPAHVLERGVPAFAAHDAAPSRWGEARIEFSYDDEATWSTIAETWNAGDAVPFYPTYPTIRARARVTLKNPNPYTNVFDVSDVDCVVAGVLVTKPTTNDLYNTDDTEMVEWISAGASNEAEIFYSSEGTNNFVSITGGEIGSNETYPGTNSYDWEISPKLTPSSDARIQVVAGNYSHISPPFTVRGIRVTHPSDDTVAVWDIGDTEYVRWVTAGIDSSARGTVALSLDGGNTYPINLLTNYALVDTPIYQWHIDSALEPTVNASLRFTIESSPVPDDETVVAVSDVFTLRGLLVADPAPGDSWQLGTTEEIRCVSAGQGPQATISYSSDGGATWDDSPVAVDEVALDGTNTYAWTIETDRKPSTNAMLRVQIDGETAFSPVFRLDGIRVDRPSTHDVWAVDQVSPIRWVGVGTSGPYDITLRYEDTSILAITNGYAGDSLDWNVLLAAVNGEDEVTNVVLVVEEAGGGVSGESAGFRIVATPRIEIESPQGGDYWKVGQDREIVWLKGGDMDAAEFHVFYWPDSKPDEVTEINEIVTYHSSNNTFTIPWHVPDELGPTRIAVRNQIHPALADTSEVFHVAAQFRVVAPNGDPTDPHVHSLEPIQVQWGTVGSATNVNLFYKHEGIGWTLINTNGPMLNSGTGDVEYLTNFSWTVPDIVTTDMFFRVQDADYSQVFDAVTPGPYDDSDHSFAVSYYEIQWDVGYVDTSQSPPIRRPLDGLRVYDSSGWEATNLSCIGGGGSTNPIVHYYPYGVYDTIWYRASFMDEYESQWGCDSNDTRRVTMYFIGAVSGITHYVAVDSTNAISPYISWMTAATTIQDAVDASNDDDTVLVSNGWYNTGGAAVGANGLSNRIAVTKAIEVRSVNGPEHTFIVGQGSVGAGDMRCAYLANGARLIGMTLTNGHARTSGGPINTWMAGGAWCESDAMISECIVVGCSATYGGGVAYGRIQNSLLIGNSALHGGGAYASDVCNCTMTDNTATFGGGAAFCDIKNSIVYYNSATNDANCHQGTCTWSCMTPDRGEQGSITNTPQFYDAAKGNYRLLPLSPCLNTGMDEYWMLSGTDLDGYPRISDGSVDMGAYEWADTDGDQLPDWEEDRVHGTAPDDLDTDDDGMPDAWEIDRSLNALLNDAAIDADLDTMSNLAEFWADTDPQDSESLLAITSLEKDPSGIFLRWQGGINAWQTIERSAELGDGADWQLLWHQDPPTAETNVLPISQSVERQFYRVRAGRM